MNFLMRSNTQHMPPEKILPIQDSHVDPRGLSNPTAMTLEGLIAQDSFPLSGISEDPYGEIEGDVGDNSNDIGGNMKNDASILVENHLDVSEEEGWIVIPDGNLPEEWSSAPNIGSLRSLDRSFVFPGEQVHLLACLSAYKQDTEFITPFKVAAVMSKNGIRKNSEKQNGTVEDERDLVPTEGKTSSDGEVANQSGNDKSKLHTNLQKDISASESILRMENHKRQTETLLQRFKDSHFFVRIAESDEPLWSKRSVPDPESTELDHSIQNAYGTKRTANKLSKFNALIDRAITNPHVSGGAARNTVNCCSLPNGDILVLLQVNVGVDFLRDPVIEILQFEKYNQKNLMSKNLGNLNSGNSDPCGELLKWLLPLDNTLPPPTRSLSPPHLSSGTGIGNTSQRSTSSGSQIFSHFRSYSMSSLPQTTAPPPQPPKAQSSKPTFDLENWDEYSSQKLWKTQKSGPEGLLSFRGVALERERFSVRCGLEGIYIPGRRWRRKLQIIQPVEIHSFAADCNTDDLLCVLVKNISPEHERDIVVFVDAITVVFEEASTGGPPSSIPIACIEAGDEHSLPNLALRRGEEHSFILKPVSSIWKNFKVHGEKISPSSSLRLPPYATGGRIETSNSDCYAIMVSCRCNYTESRLFFKQPTSWRPRISRDIMISVASEMSGELSGPDGRISQLPVQVSTLQASNLTSEDLTLTVLAPASFTSPSVGSLSSSPTTPINTIVGKSESADRIAVQRLSTAPLSLVNQKLGVNTGMRSNGQASSASDAVPNTGLGCTHLWLQSRVPLGCVPAQSTATIKLELLPLTDGIITLDTLQIDVKEKGLTYVPEHSLQINATSSISTGII